MDKVHLIFIIVYLAYLANPARRVDPEVENDNSAALA